ncbi:MAG: hypothetical protein ACYS7Y_26955 [Planctomycetota bacterium]|jgi:hypothetical protein
MREHLIRIGVGLLFFIVVGAAWVGLVALVEIIGHTISYTILGVAVVLFVAWLIGCGFRIGEWKK